MVCIDVSEAMEILAIPLLEVHCTACLSFNPVVVKPCDGGSINKVGDCTLVRQGTVCLSASLAITVKDFILLRIHLLLMIPEDLVVVLP